MESTFAHWGPLSAAVLAEMAAWRQEHPHATLAEIEAALDACLTRLRAQMLQDLALTSPLADLPALPQRERPRCPTCQRPLQARGSHTRHLQTTGGHDLALTRSYATCPACGTGLFPPG
jgi:hypothetical protein